MPYSYSQYTGNGSQTAYTFSFPYIKKADIKVRVNDVLQTETTHYTVNEITKTITFLSAPANGATIDIRRDSKKDGVEVDYTNASTLTDENLDTSNLQNLYIVQEQLDVLSVRMGLGNDDKWDANNKVIKNITNGTNPQDAVTVGQVTGLVQAGNLISMPTVTGNGDKYMKSKDDATGYELQSNSTTRTELFTVGSRSISSNDTLIASDQGNLITCTGTLTLSITAAATLGSGWFCWVTNSGSGVVTIDPNASELIDGGSTLVLNPGFGVLIQCTGAAFSVFRGQTVIDSTSIFQTGMIIHYSGTVAPSGWVLGDGKTIGSAASNATSRANQDTLSLYTLLWNSTTNTELPIQDSTGAPTTRGAGPTADFNANKRLPLPDSRGYVLAGKDDMGGTAANVITTASTNGANAIIQFGKSGSQTHTLTTPEIPAHTHSEVTYGIGSGDSLGTGPATRNGAAAATTGSTGGGGAHSNVQPTYYCSIIIKL